MNGTDFILRDRAGWNPPVPLPRRRLRWEDLKTEPVQAAEIEFIRASRGRLTTIDLGACYGVSPHTISNIWAGRRSAGLNPRPVRNTAKRKQP